MNDCKSVTYNNIEKGDPVVRPNAIPVSWINKWVEKKMGYYRKVVKRLIEDWEKDNESQD